MAGRITPPRIERQQRLDPPAVPSHRFGKLERDDLAADPDLEASSWPDTIHQVSLTFRNRDKQWQEDSVAWHDRAAFAIQGATKTESIQRPWITRQDLAWQVAAAWCQQRALPRITGRISLKAGGAGFLPDDPPERRRMSATFDSTPLGAGFLPENPPERAGPPNRP